MFVRNIRFTVCLTHIHTLFVTHVLQIKDVEKALKLSGDIMTADQRTDKETKLADERAFLAEIEAEMRKRDIPKHPRKGSKADDGGNDDDDDVDDNDDDDGDDDDEEAHAASS